MPTITIDVPEAAYATVLRRVAEALDEASPLDRDAAEDSPARPEPSAEPAPSTSSKSRPEEVWTDAAMIREHLQPRTDIPRRFMRWLAERPGSWSGTFDAYPDLGLNSAYQLGGGLSGVQRYLDERALPLPWSWRLDSEDRVVYQMHPDVAAALQANL